VPISYARRYWKSMDRSDRLRLIRRPTSGWYAIVYRGRELGHFAPPPKPVGRTWFGRRWVARCSCGWESRSRARVNADLDQLDHLSDMIQAADGVGIPAPDNWPPGITVSSTAEEWERAIRGQRLPGE